MVDRLTPENCEQYGITWKVLVSKCKFDMETKEYLKGSEFCVSVHVTLTGEDINEEIRGVWECDEAIGYDFTALFTLNVPYFQRRLSQIQEPKTIQIFHEPIKPSKSAAISYANAIVANVESMLASGHMTNDDLALVLEQCAAAKEMANKAYDEVRDLMGKRLGQNYLYGSGSKFEVKGGNKMSYDYSNCDSIKEFDNDLNVLDAQVKALKAAKSAREKQIASAYEAQRYGDLKRVDPETGVEYSDIPTPIPGSTTNAFTLAK